MKGWRVITTMGVDKKKGEVGIFYLFYKQLSSVLMHFLFLLKGLHHNADYLNIYEEGFTYILWSDCLIHVSFWGRYNNCLRRHLHSWVSCC